MQSCKLTCFVQNLKYVSFWLIGSWPNFSFFYQLGKVCWFDQKRQFVGNIHQGIGNFDQHRQFCTIIAHCDFDKSTQNTLAQVVCCWDWEV
jgi:hypothetical protein